MFNDSNKAQLIKINPTVPDARQKEPTEVKEAGKKQETAYYCPSFKVQHAMHIMIIQKLFIHTYLSPTSLCSSWHGVETKTRKLTTSFAYKVYTTAWSLQHLECCGSRTICETVAGVPSSYSTNPSSSG